jgi:hypothetical protein
MGAGIGTGTGTGMAEFLGNRTTDTGFLCQLPSWLTLVTFLFLSSALLRRSWSTVEEQRGGEGIFCLGMSTLWKRLFRSHQEQEAYFPLSRCLWIHSTRLPSSFIASCISLLCVSVIRFGMFRCIVCLAP